jgi:alpha-glucosidase
VDLDGRDPERAPIPWERPSTAGPGAGFTAGTPWLPVVEDAERLAVAVQRDDPRSDLSLWRRLIALRHGSAAFSFGAQRMLGTGEHVLAWVREDAAERLLFAIDMSPGSGSTCHLAGLGARSGRLEISTDPDRREDEVDLRNLRLAPDEGVIVRLF